MSGRARAVALGVVLLDVALLVTAVVFLLLSDRDGPQSTEWSTGGAVGLLALMVPAVAFSVVGALITMRRSEHPVGWLCAAIGALWMVIVAASAVDLWSETKGVDVGAAEWLSWLGAAWVPAVGLMGTHLPLRLPDGRLPSPRWRWYSRFCTPVLVVATVLIATEPVDDNPLAIDLPGWVWAFFALLPLTFVGALASVVVRYRRTRDARPRAQIRWIAFGAAIFIGSYLAILLLFFGLGVSEDGAAGQALTTLVTVGYAGIPIAIGIAVLRHRLYEIDRIINRTLVYGSVTAVLAACYVGLVLVLRSALGPLTDGNGLAVAVSTLAVASVFRPVRRRAQTLVDRRFYRHRYDAERTLERFGARLRAETDLAALQAELTAVVRESMQPAHVSLWLRPPSTGTPLVTMSGRGSDTTVST